MLHHPTIPERMAAVIAGAGDAPVAALQRAGFTGPEIADHIDAANALLERRRPTPAEPPANLLDAVQRARGLARIGTLLASCEFPASRETTANSGAAS